MVRPTERRTGSAGTRTESNSRLTEERSSSAGAKTKALLWMINQPTNKEKPAHRGMCTETQSQLTDQLNWETKLGQANESFDKEFDHDFEGIY